MDLFSRLYHIVRANTSADEGDFKAADPPRYRQPDYETRADAGPIQDPTIAGYYANLELPYGADLGEVKSAWKRMMKKYHPDRHSQDPEKRQVANELCAELTRAYRELEQHLSAI